MAFAFWLGSPVVERVHSSQSEIAVSADDFFDISFGDLQEELQLVREEGKSALLVMFEMEDCPWCERMKAQVLNRVQVQDYFHENFRIISVDVEGDPTGDPLSTGETCLLPAAAGGAQLTPQGRAVVLDTYLP